MSLVRKCKLTQTPEKAHAKVLSIKRVLVLKDLGLN